MQVLIGNTIHTIMLHFKNHMLHMLQNHMLRNHMLHKPYVTLHIIGEDIYQSNLGLPENNFLRSVNFHEKSSLFCHYNFSKGFLIKFH